MGVRDRIARLLVGEQRFNLGQYPQFLQDYYSQFGYAGALYPLQLNQSMAGWSKTEEISASLPNYITALRKSPPAFAAQLVRASVLSQARLTFRNRSDKHIFRTDALRQLERPWTNGTTGELLSRMEWHAGLAGNAYVYRRPDRLRVLRPDWTAIVYGSQSEPDDPKGALDGEVLGYAYINGGFSQGNKNKVTVLLPEEVAHWSPLPDPMSPGLGMSWVTPALRDIQADTAALEHKLAYFSNGATPNLVIKGLPSASTAQFKDFVDAMESSHKGSVNAFKTLYLTAGADATVIGSNLAELDLSSITSHGETRVSYLSRVPAVILGIAAGLKGSSLNAGNYGEARRNFADSWYYSTLQDACAALAAITQVPGGCELWYDVADVPLLREDSKDAADIEQVKATTINSYIMAGFTPESAITAVQGQNVALLKHTGLVSVQLFQPGTVPVAPGAAEKPAAPASVPSGRSVEISEARGMVEAVRDMVRDMPQTTVNITNQPPGVTVNNTVEPAAVTVEPPDVVNNVTVQPAAAPTVTNEFAAPTISIDMPTPVVNVDAPVTVNLPADPPSQGIDLIYDGDDKIIGTRPRNRK